MTSRMMTMPMGAVLLASLTACQVRGIPTHGGGKRFFREQEVLAMAVQSSLDGIDWGSLRGQKVNVFIFALGDEGGGIQSGGGFNIPGIGMNAGAIMPVSSGAMTGSAGMGYEGLSHAPYAVANARDIDYLRGAVMTRIFEGGGSVLDVGERGNRSADVVVLAHTFGIDRWTDRDLLVLTTEHLDARVALSAYLVPQSGAARPINREPGRWSQADAYYIEEYVVGFLRDEDGRLVDPASDPGERRG